MKMDRLSQLLDRITYCSEKALGRSGEGFSYSATLSDGITQRYELENIRDLSCLEYEISNWCVWVWSLKDFICREAKAQGRPSDWWKIFVEDSIALQLTADLANRDKHGEDARTPWSKIKPRFGKPSCCIPQEAMRKLNFSDSTVKIEVEEPSGVEFDVPIFDSNGTRIGNALEVLSDAMDAWDVALRELGVQKVAPGSKA